MNIPKAPSKEVLNTIDTNLQYFPISGHLFYLKRPRYSHIKDGDRLKTVTLKGYLEVKINGRIIKLHHIAWYKFYGCWPSKELDHKNENKQDNSILNLREVNHNQNRWNISIFKNNKLGHKNIRLTTGRSNPYVIRVARNGTMQCCVSPTLEEAILKRDALIKEYV